MSAPRPILNPDLRRIADALRLGLDMMEAGARGSGRTTRMLERITPETRILVTESNHGRHLARTIADQGMAVRKIITVDPRRPLFDQPGHIVMADGTWPTLPDHTWVERRLRALVEDAVAQVQYELDQVDLPMTAEEIRAQRANYLAREATPEHRRPQPQPYVRTRGMEDRW